MLEKQFPKMLIFASAAVVLCAITAAVVESGHKAAAPADKAATASNEPIATSNPTPLITSNPTSNSPLPVQTSFPATTRAQAEASARASISTRDPMRPLIDERTSSASQPPAIVGQHKTNRTHSRSGNIWVPPPPPEYNQSYSKQSDNKQNYKPEYETANSQQDSEPPRFSRAALADYLKLVGVIDNKAIFTVPQSVADDLQLARSSFTLAKGEEIDGVTLESVSSDSATVRAGRKLSVKSLQPIR